MEVFLRAGERFQRVCSGTPLFPTSNLGNRCERLRVTSFDFYNFVKSFQRYL